MTSQTGGREVPQQRSDKPVGSLGADKPSASPAFASVAVKPNGAFPRWAANAIDAALLVVPVLYAAVLCVQFRRGFDFTDEGYYLVNFVHWRNALASLTFFGAYFAPPFAWLGESVWGIRVLGLVLLVGSTVYFAARFFESVQTNGVQARFRVVSVGVLAGVAMAFYAPWSTLFTPGYNLLSLVLILVSSGTVLAPARTPMTVPQLVLYGLCLGALFFVKFPAYFVTVAAHLLITVNGAPADRRSRLIARVLASAVLGVCANFVFLLAVGGDILRSVSTGLQYLQILQPRNPLLEVVLLLFVAIPKMLFASAPTTWPVAVLAIMGALYGGQSDRWLVLAILAVIATAFGPWSFGGVHGARYSAVLFAIGGIVLMSNQRLALARCTPRLVVAPPGVLLLVVTLLPVALVIGTSNELRYATAMGIVFPVAVCLALLLRLHGNGVLPPYALRACVGVIGLAPVALINAPWNDAYSTYRLGAALRAQESGITIGGGTIAVDDATAAAVREYRATLARLGFTSSGAMLDLTGAGPGLVYLAGATPTGRA